MDNKNKTRQPLDDLELDAATGGSFVGDLIDDAEYEFTKQTFTCARCGQTYKRTPLVNQSYLKLSGMNICNNCLNNKNL